MDLEEKTPRRAFLGGLAGTAITLPAFMTSFSAEAGPTDPGLLASADEWLKKIKGKHRICYDAPEPHDGFPIAWSYVFYKTNNDTGSPDSDLTAVVVLRHNAIPMAMKDNMWEKYKLGEGFKITDPVTSAAAVKNPFWMPDNPFWVSMGIQGMKALGDRGVLFCVCDMALTVYSSFTAKAANLKPEDVKADWVANLHPGIQIVPSGVWAINRAQEKGCSYCYAGG